MEPELKKLFDEQLTAFASFRKTNDERLLALEKKQGTAELEARLERIEGDLKNNEKAFLDYQAKANRITLGSCTDSMELKAFSQWARNSEDGKGKFKATLTTDFDPGAGYTVLPELELAIERVAGKTSVMRQLAFVQTISTGSFQKLVSKSGATGGWRDENTSISTTETSKLDLIEIYAREMYANPKASQQLLDDSAVDIAQWFSDEVGETFGELEGNAFINGSGMTQPDGLLKYNCVNNNSYSWGKIGYVLSGANGKFVEPKGSEVDPVSPGDTIINLIHALKPKYRFNGVFLMSDSMLAVIRKLKTTFNQTAMNAYLWEPSFQLGVPGRLLGYPVYTDDNMPDMTNGSLSIAFGDFKRAYTIVDRRGISIIKDPYTNKGMIEFYTSKRVGGGITNFEAVKLMKFSAHD